jgi:hypothetical protein
LPAHAKTAEGVPYDVRRIQDGAGDYLGDDDAKQQQERSEQ